MTRLLRRLALISLAVAEWAGSAVAAAAPRDSIVYLLPAPRESVMLAPFLLADHRGYYAAEGLRVIFRTVPGGAKVGEALSRGEGDLGGASGDTPILLRERGFAVKGVALLGGHAFLTIMADRRARIAPATMAGKRFGVPSFTDISYYALDAWRRASAIEPGALSVAALSPPALWEQLGRGDLDAIVGTVDWGVRAQRSGITLDYDSADRHFPAMAQAILASDAAIANNPRAIRKFVRATLRAVNAIRRQPKRSAHDYRNMVQQSDLTEHEIATVFSLLGRHVYAGQHVAGAFDGRRVAALQDAYLELGLVRQRRDPTLFFTNDFTHE